MSYKAHIEVTCRPGVLDPEARAVKEALERLGFTGLGSTRVGKLIEIDLDAGRVSRFLATMRPPPSGTQVQMIKPSGQDFSEHLMPLCSPMHVVIRQIEAFLRSDMCVAHLPSWIQTLESHLSASIEDAPIRQFKVKARLT